MMPFEADLWLTGGNRSCLASLQQAWGEQQQQQQQKQKQQ
jgi:hypothetical protein